MQQATWRFGIAAVAIALLPSAIHGQAVDGRVRAADTLAPVPTAFVLLLDSADRRVAATLSNASGAFSLQTPSPGRYRLRVERIGYATHTSRPLELGAGARIEHTIEMHGRAIPLEGVTAEGDRRCTITAEQGVLATSLWEEARKSLRVGAWTTENRRLHFRTVTFEQPLDTLENPTRNRKRWAHEGLAREPFDATPVEVLQSSGYVQPSGQRHIDVYHGPGFDVLLSDLFLDTHCISVRLPGAREEGMIGLAFRPLAGFRNPDIRGVLWLDAGTAELRYVEYDYVGLELGYAAARLGGRMEFERLATGDLIIRRWWIRVPIVSPAVRGVRLTGYIIKGGRVERVSTPHGLVLFMAPLTEAIRDEQAKVLRTVRPLSPDRLVLGQFRGYRDDPGVASDSRVPTTPPFSSSSIPGAGGTFRSTCGQARVWRRRRRRSSWS